MRKILPLLPLLFFLNVNAQEQVTDTEIAKSLLGQPYYQVNTILDSLNVYYVEHLPNGLKSDKRVYSIANSNDDVKVYRLFLSDVSKKIIKIVINFRHDDINHLKDLSTVFGASDFHVGTYSTDVTFK